MEFRGKNRKEKSPLMITEMKITLEDVHGGGKHCENTHTHKEIKQLMRPTSQGDGNKNKNKQAGPN